MFIKRFCICYITRSLQHSEREEVWFYSPKFAEEGLGAKKPFAGPGSQTQPGAAAAVEPIPFGLGALSHCLLQNETNGQFGDETLLMLSCAPVPLSLPA